MHKLTRMTYSRNDWKNKARDRADKLRDFRKRDAKKDKKIKEVEAELERTKQLLEKVRNEKEKMPPVKKKVKS